MITLVAQGFHPVTAGAIPVSIPFAKRAGAVGPAKILPITYFKTQSKTMKYNLTPVKDENGSIKVPL